MICLVLRFKVDTTTDVNPFSSNGQSTRSMATVPIPKGEVQDRQTVTPEGVSVDPLPAGVTFRETPTHVDSRGSLFELFNPEWAWHPDPLVYCYCCTIRPGKVKGWAMHKRHEDRYFVMFGEMEVVFYDSRPESATFGLVAKVVLTEFNRRLMNIPAGIWHAVRCVSEKEVVLTNFPTIPYDHADPDKYRLPLDTDQIPYKFDDSLGY